MTSSSMTIEAESLQDPSIPEEGNPFRHSLLRRRMRIEEVERAGLVAHELELCRRSVFHWLHWWVWTYDPRLAATHQPTHLPFDLWPRQVELLRWLDERVRAREDGLVEKSRDMGFTYLMGAYALHHWQWVPGFKTTFGSRIASLVDKIGDPDSIFEKIRAMLRGEPRWMLPEGFNSAKHDNAFLLVNPN